MNWKIHLWERRMYNRPYRDCKLHCYTDRFLDELQSPYTSNVLHYVHPQFFQHRRTNNNIRFQYNSLCLDAANGTIKTTSHLSCCLALRLHRFRLVFSIQSFPFLLLSLQSRHDCRHKGKAASQAQVKHPFLHKKRPPCIIKNDLQGDHNNERSRNGQISKIIFVTAPCGE